MHNLRLWGGAFESPEDVVGWLGAVQSQDYGPAKWAVGARLGCPREGDVERAFAEGRILRTHVLRPTWHFVLPADIRWMLELTGPRVHAMNAYYCRQAGLDAAVLRKCTNAVVKALEGGRQRTRKELETRLAQAGIVATGMRLAYILMHAELNGVICSGALKGKQHTYALLDERAKPAPKLSRDEALAELARRYFTSHGPATVKDFRWWSSLSLAEIKTGLALVGSQLEQQAIDGVTYWFAAGAPASKPPSPTVHLLQGYDEYIVGYSESKYVLDVAGAARWTAQDRPTFNLVVVLDSQVAGFWKRTVTKEALVIHAALTSPFDAVELRALDAAAKRHADFLRLPSAVVTTEWPATENA